MKKVGRILLKIVSVMIVIGALLFIILSSENVNTVNAEQQRINIKFIRTFCIIKDLDRTDQTGEFKYYVIDQFQADEPTVIKIDKKYILEENSNYEFTFEGETLGKNDYTIREIVDNFKIIGIEKTDKTGLEQRQDLIY